MSSDDRDNIELHSSSQGEHGDATDEVGPMAPTSNYSSVYETRYQKSLRHYLTREALPKESHYRNLNSIVDGSARPTMDDLHNNTYRGEHRQSSLDPDESPARSGKVIKFGWLEGVYMRCLLNIWGVMLFLRVSWMVGQAGVLVSLLIVCMGNTVTIITTLSMSAVATNGRIKAGGVYYMISRSLGPEFGGSIGLMFTLANSIAAATYIIGFCDSMKDMLLQYFGVVMIDGATNDIRVLGTGTLVAVLALAIVGMDWVTRVQMGLLFLLIGSQIDFIVGVFMGPQSEAAQSKGFIGLSNELLNRNLYPNYRRDEGKQYDLFKVFAVFFPAVTGIVAGANLSGDLKDPGTAIPKGTLGAIGTTFITYMIYPIMLGATVTRDALGDLGVFKNSTVTYPEVLDNVAFSNQSCFLGGEGLAPADGPQTCEFGLHNSIQAMELVSAWGPLIYMGCFAATLSSAIASLVGAPRVLQALAKDRLYPGLHIFEKGHGANNDPFRGYILVFVISLACIMIGDLNVVSTLLSNFFLASYSLINISCFHASFVKSPGWRPSFKYYNKWVSLVGGIMCLMVMFLIDLITALITFVTIVALYMFVSYRKPDVNWGSSTQGQTYVSALTSALNLVNVEEHVKNYRPQILILSGRPGSRPPLIDFANMITKNISLLICGNIVKEENTQRARNTMLRQGYNWLSKHKIKAFYNTVEFENFEIGAKSLFQLSGLGKLRPNIILLGFKANWNKCNHDDLRSYFNTLHEALDMHYGLAILRVPNGLDYSRILEDDDTPVVANGTGDATTTPNNQETEDLARNQSASQLSQDGTASEASSPPGSPDVERAEVVANANEKLKRRSSLADLYHGPGGVELPKDVLNNITLFKRKQKKGTIDVWWLYDDGGLTLLIPYILSLRSQWSSCKLRVFALANRKDELDMEQRSMANLLAKFRIDFSDMIVIPDAAKKAKDNSRKEFEELIHDFKAKSDEEAKENEGISISEAELLGQREKTNRHIRLRELLLEYSTDASLVVMTLPMPRKTSVSAPLYMAWLETLTKGMPPFLLIRGNQTSVLTYYS